jgi:hypothetical protein
VLTSEDDFWFVRQFHPGKLAMLERVSVGSFVDSLSEESRISFSAPFLATRYFPTVDAELRAHRLGYASVDNKHILLQTADFQWAMIARGLATAILRRDRAPSDTTVDQRIDATWYRHHVYLPERLRDAPAGYMLGLDFLSRSRKRPRAGDVFVYRVGGSYHFGRVVRVGLDLLGSSRGALLYFYRAESVHADVLPAVSKQDLVIPPVLTDGFMWREGAFQTVQRAPLAGEDLLERHCFESRVLENTWYQNEYGERVERTDPCGVAGPINVLRLDVSLCNAWNEPGRPLLESSSPRTS